MPQKTLLSMSFSGHTSKRAYGTTSGSYTYGKYCNYDKMYTTTCSGETIYYYETGTLTISGGLLFISTEPIVCACYNANMEQVKCPSCVIISSPKHPNIRGNIIS